MPFETAITAQTKAALLLLLISAVCDASVIPYMSVYIVETLGKEPWMIAPAISFYIASISGPWAVFWLALGLCAT
jgi:hypothetical protein